MTKLKSLIEKMIVSATAIATGINADSESQSNNKALSNEFTDTDHKSIEISNKPKLIFKSVATTNDLMLVSHRSHRSHSSHRSHYSSRSSGKKIDKKPEAKKLETPSSTKKSTITSNDLGTRVLKLGSEGKDVFKLKEMMILKGYKAVKLNDIFDEMLELAVKDFQAKKGVEVDGKVGPMTVYMLKYE